MENIEEVNGKLLKECTEKWKEAYKRLYGENEDFSGIFLINNFVAKEAENQIRMDALKEILFRLELHSIILEEETDKEKENKRKELEEIKLELENM